MRQAIELIVSGIKCDADGCDYSDQSAAASDYAIFLNCPCPKCGAPLLTEADLALMNLLAAGSDYVNSILRPIAEEPRYQYLKIEMDGSGIPIGIKDVTNSKDMP